MLVILLECRLHILRPNFPPEMHTFEDQLGLASRWIHTKWLNTLNSQFHLNNNFIKIDEIITLILLLIFCYFAIICYVAFVVELQF